MIRALLVIVFSLLMCRFAPAVEGYARSVLSDKPVEHLDCNDGGVSAPTSLLNHATPLFDLERKRSDVAKLTESCTIEWWQYVASAAEAQPVFQVGEQTIGVIPIANPKPKDPPAGNFAIGTVRSKTVVTGGKWFHVAIARADGKAQFFINGQPDGEAQPVQLGDKLKLASNASGETMVDEIAVYALPLPPERIAAHFREALPPRKVVTVAHRGDNHGSPENTNIAYVNALAMHAPILEMDLRLTKDNVLVLLHDATVDRTTDGKGKIAEMTMAEAEKLDAGSWKDAKFKGEPIPRVEDIVKTFRGKAWLMLDLKCTGLGPALADLKKKLDLPADQWLLAPWEDEEGVALRKHLPDVPMIRLTSKLPTDRHDEAYFARMKQIGFSGFSVNWQNLTQAFINSAHQAQMKVYTWTLNDGPDIAGAVLANVDGVITDKPADTMELVQTMARQP